MAQPPNLPNFEKSKFSAVPLFSTFWDFLFLFTKQTVEALRKGLTVRENLSAAWVDINVPAGQTYPMREMQNPLPGGARIHGVLVAGVFDPATPNVASLTASTAPLTITTTVTPSSGTATATSTGTAALPALGVFVDWTVGVGGGLVVLGITGLPNATRTVRVLVLAE